MRLAVQISGIHGPLLDEFLGSDGMKGEHSPSLLVHDKSVPGRSGDCHPPLLGHCARLAHQPVPSPALRFTDLEDSAPGKRERALVAVRMPFGSGLSTGANAE